MYLRVEGSGGRSRVTPARAACGAPGVRFPSWTRSGLVLFLTRTSQPAPALAPLAGPAKGSGLCHEPSNPHRQALNPPETFLPAPAGGGTADGPCRARDVCEEHHGRVWEGSRHELSRRAGHLFFSAIKRIGVNDFSELLLLLMNNLFGIFSEEHGLGLGLKAQFD